MVTKTKNGKKNKLTANCSGEKQNKFKPKSSECDSSKCIKKKHIVSLSKNRQWESGQNTKKRNLRK